MKQGAPVSTAAQGSGSRPAAGNTPQVAAGGPGQKQRRLSRLGRFRIRTMDLYVARTFLQAYAVCGVSFVGLFVLIEAFSKLDRFLRQDSSLIVTIFKYHLAMIPVVYANYIGPMLTLAAGMFTMTSLNRQNELAPLKAAGVSVYRVMAPIFFLAACLAAGTFYLKDSVLPRFKDPIRAALALSRTRPLTPLPYFDKDHGYLIRVREYSSTRKIARGVEISERHPNSMLKEQIDADQMEWVPATGDDALGSGSGGVEEGGWVLRDGSIQRHDEQGNLIVNASASKFERLKAPFKEMVIEMSLRPVDLETSDPEISYLSWRDLKTQYQRQPYHRHLEVKLHHHFALPLSHIVLLFLGTPFVLNFRNRSGFLSIAASFMICAVFFLVSSICMNIANQSQVLEPVFAAWLPVMLFGALGITMFDHVPT